ncbi:MAG: methyltransferase domain-containing protein [Chlamydiales bacterium]|nr:methyltransferase domain-containing protein [Chlamydiales bacterium]
MMTKQFLILLVIFASSLFGSHWNEEQVVDYVHYSELQRRSSWHLLSQVKFRGNEKVLDVGCGDGRNSAWIAWLVREGSVVGIDPSNAMIAWAKKQYHPFEFPNLVFIDGDANRLPEGTFDIITTFFSLHVVKERQSAIQGFFDQLSDGGYVFAVIPPAANNPEFADAVRETMQDPCWQPYFKDFQSTFRFEDLESYINYFNRAGFSILYARDIPSVDPFSTRNEAINWFKGTWPHVHYIPKGLQEVFIGDMIDRYIQKRSEALSKEGVLYFYWGHYEIIAKK